MYRSYLSARLPRRHAVRRRGWTLLEVTFYLTIAAIISVPIMGTALVISRSMEEGDMLSKILERNRSALHRVAGEFRTSIGGTGSVTNGGKTLTFTLSAGFDGTGATTGSVIRYDIAADPNDPANGLDDNNNGVIDEKVLVRTDQSTNEVATIAAYLDDGATGFVAAGDSIAITITTIGRKRGSATQSTVTQTLQVFPRN